MNHRLKLVFPWALLLAAVLVPTACAIADADAPADATVEDLNKGWTTAHNQSRNIAVTPPAGWAVDRVDYSVDNGQWMQAVKAGPNLYTIALTNLDIGDSEIVVRVQSSYRGQIQVDSYSGRITGVVAEFNCADPKSMLPTAQLIQDNGTEVRTMLGYFGDSAEHTVTFTIGYRDVWNNAYQNVASIVNYGRNSITAEFDVSSATCDTRPMNDPQDCTLNYSLSVVVDGGVALTCTNESFGTVLNYYR